MAGIDLQNAFCLDISPVRHRIEHLLHLHGNGAFGGQADRMTLQAMGQTNFTDFVSQDFLHLCKQILIFLCLLFSGLLFLIGFSQIQILCGNRLEFLSVILPQHLYSEFIHVICHVKDLIAFILQLLRLRKLVYLVNAGAGCIINILLVILHSLLILLEGDQLFLGAGIIHQKILQHLLVLSKIGIDTKLQLQTKVLEERLIIFSLLLLHIQQLILDLLFQTLGDGL